METTFGILCLLIVNFISSDASPFEIQVDENNVLSTASLVTLEFTTVITRHGSRTPLRTYPNDPYPYTNRLFWPSGPDELTYYGKKQLYQTGEKLRARYNGFLPELFYPNDTVAEYNNYNRDFMSASCLMASLYPPVGDAVWNKNLLWQPIPLYLRTFDVCNLPYKNACPSYKTESDRLIDKLDQEGITNSATAKLLKDVSLFTGSNITKISKLYDVYDVLTMQQENGFKLPWWTKQFYPQPLRSTVTPVLLTQYGGSDYLVRMGAGPELKRISNMLNMKANGTFNENRKFYVEAAHDCTLVALLKAMGNNDSKLEVRTSAYMIFELHYLPEIYIVQVLYYQNSTVDNPEFINISGCPTPCSLEQFTKFVDSINPPDWNQECQEKPPKPETSLWERL